MKKKQNAKKSLNRFELVWSGYSGIEWASRRTMDAELNVNFGKYSVFNGTHHISYGKKFKDETKLKIISAFDYEEHLNDILLSEAFEPHLNFDFNHKNPFVLFSFKEIRRSHEIIALQALMSIGTNLESTYWENWLLLEDGTILNNKDTKKYFKDRGGIDKYITQDLFRSQSFTKTKK